MSTPEQMREELLRIATAFGAGQHLIDDVVDQVRAEGGAVVTCESVGKAATDKRLAPLGSNSRVKAVRDEVVGAVRSATCGFAKTLEGALFTKNIEKIMPVTVYGTPTRLENSTTGRHITFEYRLPSSAKESVTLTFTPADSKAYSEATTNRTATLRVHADGRATFVKWGPGRLRTVVVGSATAGTDFEAGNKPMYTVTFKDPGTGKAFAPFKYYHDKGDKVAAGERAQVFVSDENPGSIMYVYKWLDKAQEYSVVVNKYVEKGGKYDIVFKSAGAATKEFATYTYDPSSSSGGPTKIFVGDAVKVWAFEQGGKMQISKSPAPTFTNFARQFRVAVKAVQSVTNSPDDYFVTFEQASDDGNKAGIAFNRLKVRFGATVGDTAEVYARQAGATYQIVGTPKWERLRRQPPVTLAPTSTPVPYTESPIEPTPTAAAYEEPGGIKIDLNITNDNDNQTDSQAEGEAGGGKGWGYDVVDVVPIGGTDTKEEDDPTQAPEDAPVTGPTVCPPANCSPCAPSNPPGLPASSTLFCMSRRTFMIMICMLVFACVLACIGFWVWRRRRGGGGAGSAPPLGDLGGLDLGPVPR